MTAPAATQTAPAHAGVVGASRRTSRQPWFVLVPAIAAAVVAIAPVWYLLAEDEGHGFAKKANADFQFAAMTSFYDKFLLKRPTLH